MSAESSARDHIESFKRWVGNPELALAEAELRDLAALRDAVEEAIALHVRAVVTYEGISWAAVADSLASDPASLRRRYGR